jgi:aspartyl-tRNA(Asn)/glutamyl-tRNA(Gln) amidotransferase subunit B
MRSKEDAHDYRYFPEPDLPPLHVGPEWIEEVRRSLPELPRARAARYQRELSLSAYDAGLLTADREVAELFDATLAARGGGAEAAKRVANWVNGEVARLGNETGLPPSRWKLSPAALATVLRLADEGALNAAGVKQVLAEVFARGTDPEAVVREKGLAQVSDAGAVEAAVDKVLAAHPAEAARYRGGERKLLGFLVGQVMREMKGKGNPALVNAALTRKLGG